MTFAVSSEHRKAGPPTYGGRAFLPRSLVGVCATTTETHSSGFSRAASHLSSSLAEPKYSISRREAATKVRVSAAHEATSTFNRPSDLAFMGLGPANDTAVQRRAREGAQRPTRPSVCNGGLGGSTSIQSEPGSPTSPARGFREETGVGTIDKSQPLPILSAGTAEDR